MKTTLMIDIPISNINVDELLLMVPTEYWWLCYSHECKEIGNQCGNWIAVVNVGAILRCILTNYSWTVMQS